METPSTLVDVVHPTGNQFVRSLLSALDASGQLGIFHTALGFAESQPPRFIPDAFRQECQRRSYAIAPARLRSRPWREATRLASQKMRWSFLNRHETGWASLDNVYQDLDRTVAAKIPVRAQNGVGGVYGYEDGCVETFRAAKRKGVKCFYDLPIAYWRTLRAILQQEKERLPAWEPTLVGTRDSEAKLERKTEEAALADVIVVPSLFVLNSLPDSLRAEKECVVAEFGSPAPSTSATHREEGVGKKLRLLFAGSMTQRKGLADVFAAMKILQRKDVELVVMGSPIAPMEFYRREYADFTYMPTRPHGEVLALMQSCDALVLPSLVEGRALVQQEAMANGLPLIITENTGGEDLIVPGETGFLVPIRRPDLIAEKMAWLADHREALPAMRTAAVRKASEYPWSRYQRLILAALNGMLEPAENVAATPA